MQCKPGAFEPGPRPDALQARVEERVRSRPAGVLRFGGRGRAIAPFDLLGLEGE